MIKNSHIINICLLNFYDISCKIGVISRREIINNGNIYRVWRYLLLYK